MPGQNTEKPELCVIDDWSEELPILEAEMELLEAHMLDIITAMVQHG